MTCDMCCAPPKRGPGASPGGLATEHEFAHRANVLHEGPMRGIQEVTFWRIRLLDAVGRS